MKAEAIIVAGGSGLRMKNDIPKQYLSIGDVPVLTHTLRRFEAAAIDGVVLVVPGGDIDYVRENIVGGQGIEKVRRIIAGGKRRQDSVYNGLVTLEEDTDIVVIHDGVRPFVTVSCIDRVVEEAKKRGAVTAGIPVTDTLKRVNAEGCITGTVDRNELWCAQTPQAFRREVILRAYESARDEGFQGTDDASLVERIGIEVRVTPGSPDNMKITTKEDLTLARFLAGRFFGEGDKET